MNDLPLHPVVVHLPLVLAFLAPVVSLAAVVASFRFGYRRAHWAVASILLAVLFVGAFVAKNTGENEESVVETIVGHDAIHEHEEQAEALVLTSGIACAISLLALAAGERRTLLVRFAGVATLVASLSLVAIAIRVGHSGGELVYVHGAAEAYYGGGQAVAAGGVGGEVPASHED